MKKYITLISIYLFLVPSRGTEESKGFFTYHSDYALSGYVRCEISTNMILKWKKKLSSAVVSAPVSDSKVIYVAASDGNVYSIDFKGKEIWQQKLISSDGNGEIPDIPSSPVTIASELLAIGSASGVVYVMDKTGKIKWKYKIDNSNILGSPNFINKKDGKQCLIAMTQSNGIVVCFDLMTGEKIWESKETNRCDGSPAVSDKIIVYGNCDSAVYILDVDNGEILASVDAGEDSQIAGGVAIGDGKVYSGTRRGALICVDIESKEIVWSNEDSSGELFTTPALKGDKIVFSGGDGNVYCINAKNGEKLWVNEKNAAALTSPLITRDDKVVVGMDGELVILDIKDGKRLWSYKCGDSLTEACIVNGMIFVGTAEGYLLCFGPREMEGK